jgi:Cellobiose phosphorylase
MAPKGRYLYCREEGKGEEAIWTPSFGPAKTPLDRYLARFAPGTISYSGERNGLLCESLHFLPLRGRFEIWRVALENRGHAPRDVLLAPQMEFLLQPGYEVDLSYYSWYTDSSMSLDRKILSVSTHRPHEREYLGFFSALDAPDGYEASRVAFFGQGDQQRPASLFSESPSCGRSGGDPYIACYRYRLRLEPEERWETSFFIGEGDESLSDAKARFSSMAEVDRELLAVKAHWDSTLAKREAKSAFSDGVAKAWSGCFLPYQIFQQSLGMIRFAYKGYRDVAQDAVGMSYYDLEASRCLILSLLGMQHEDGRCLRQWNAMGGPHDERDFRDLPFWLVFAVHKYLSAGGDPSILHERRPYLEGGEPATLMDHAERGLEYAVRLGAHGLIKIGVGDWNDALSALGPGGESLWLNEMAYLCLGYLKELSERWGGELSLDPSWIDATRESLFDATLAGWTGEWFLRGYHESGVPIGAADRIFLLPQAWFTISGMAEREPEKARIALDSMVGKLACDDGLLKCFPAFSAFDERIGNLSALTPGVAENFAVYNHASAFGVYALLMAERSEASEFLDKILPFRKDPERTLVEPYVLVNYYNGGYYPERAGRGGITWLTGTANWLAMIVFDFLVPRESFGTGDRVEEK